MQNCVDAVLMFSWGTCVHVLLPDAKYDILCNALYPAVCPSACLPAHWMVSLLVVCVSALHLSICLSVVSIQLSGGL